MGLPNKLRKCEQVKTGDYVRCLPQDTKYINASLYKDRTGDVYLVGPCPIENCPGRNGLRERVQCTSLALLERYTKEKRACIGSSFHLTQCVKLSDEEVLLLNY